MPPKHSKDLFVRFLLEMLEIQPVQFLDVEDRPRFPHALEGELLNEFCKAEKLTLIPRIPAEKRYEVHERFFEIPFCPVVFDRNIALTFAQFAFVRIEEQRQMGEDREIPSEIPVQENVLWCARQPFLSANNVTDLHQVIVHDDSEVIRGKSVRFQQDLIIEDLVAD